MRNPLDRLVGIVTTYNKTAIAVMLVLSVAVLAGLPMLQMESRISGDASVNDTEVGQKQAYIGQHYAVQQESNTTAAVVYLRDDDGNALSKESLLASLRYQQSVRENGSLAAALDGGGVQGVANVVATGVRGEPGGDLETQIETIESMSPAEVEQAVSRTLSEGSPALELLPNDYTPGTATAASHRMVFQLQPSDEAAETAATKALYDAAAERDSPELFTLGQHAFGDLSRQQLNNTVTLVLPLALLAILAVLAFAYRDLVDVIVGFVGTVLSVLWMFGILGWLQVSAGVTLIVGPVLIVGLSVDYGLHVFMRYREQRGEDEGIREPMGRSLRSVAIALALVTVTTVVGFLSNVTSDFGPFRDLAIGISLGVLSAFVIFVTLVPALKVSIDGLLERFGLDRRKQPLGESRLLKPVLSGGVTLARRAAPVVIVLALLVGTVGGAAWTQLDRLGFQQNSDGVAEWKQDLPGPLAWEVSEVSEQNDYVDEHYRAADQQFRTRSQLLIEGTVTSETAIAKMDAATDSLAESGVAFERGGAVPFVSPLSVAQSLAADHDEVAQALQQVDTDGDGTPEQDVTPVYDAMYAVAPGQASQVIERTDGEYRSVRIVVPMTQSSTYADRTDAMYAAENVVEDGTDLTATGVGPETINAALSAQIADSVVGTLALALGAVFVMLVVVYRIAEGSASLGALTVLPIALVAALVIGGMYLADIPVTFLTALLMSLVIGLGIDYNIHISDRFAQERERAASPVAALQTALVGTGGALLGSTLTSVGAFAALLLHPNPQISSFGTLVVLTLTLSFVVSVFVLPSLLLLWAEYRGGEASLGKMLSPSGTTAD